VSFDFISDYLIIVNDTVTTKKDGLKNLLFFLEKKKISFYTVGLVVICGVSAVPCFPKSALCGAEFPPKG